MDTTLSSVMEVLGKAEVSALDSARFVRNILDAKPSDSKLTDAQFVLKVIEVGLRHIRTKEMSFAEGFKLYYETKKKTLRPDSLRDIRYLGNRLMRSNPQLANRNFSELTVSDCEELINAAFHTPSQFKRSANEISPQAKDPKGEAAHEVSASQFNKARTMLHAIFEFAIRREWCDKNPIKRIERRKVIEKEIQPLKLSETKRLIKNAQRESPKYAVVAALLIYAGIRPREVRRLSWRDIDTEEKTITVRSQCSKTGGVRHVEISPVLNSLLIVNKTENHSPVCPADWQRRWRKIRDNSGFKGHWVQDVLRHTYASYFAKRYSDLPRLQLNMGHRDLSLLRSRYVNMQSISKTDAKEFFD
ncbi:tyrosine-type recombinase/integrase [Intestinicryptomonas porci]|uniref:Tyrosine-type recombinase/integrase n=1 Tax=Intestinicryptomonas porci TaxID=2926320 RepID=A0ABU4WHG7_9BACT|nr:tyrosine-type recombinase/integrase [Opitutales bacterium CLA-KB-P66]